MGTVKRRILSLFLAMVMLYACFPAAVSADNEVDLTPDAPSSVDTLDLPSYYDYVKTATAPAATAPIQLTVENAVLSADTATRIHYQNKDAVSLTANGYAEWTVTVPADAAYTVALQYAAEMDKEKDNGQTLELALMVDGQHPFREAAGLELKRLWKDATAIQQDRKGNDLVPEQQELTAWQTAPLNDTTGYTNDSYKIRLTAGTHTIRLTAGDYPLYLAAVTLGVTQKHDTYANVLAKWKAEGLAPVSTPVFLKYAAESTSLKSDCTIIPSYDLGNAATETATGQANSPDLIKRNIIGGTNWKEAGEWIEYEVNAPADGLYCLTFKYRQNISMDMTVYRNVYINGAMPFAELQNVGFPFSFEWNNLTLQDANGAPMYVKLQKGRNTIRLEATTGAWAPILLDVDALSKEMNDLYRRIIMVTGTSPDPYRDYFLTNEIRGLPDMLASLAARTNAAADEFERINGGVSQQSAVLRTVADQMDVFAKQPSKIEDELATFREKITALTDWLLNNKEQPLELDYFIVHNVDAEIPDADGSWWDNLVFKFLQFLATFSADYASLEEYGADQKVITVWISDGRDQATIMKDLIADRFTKETGIAVNVNLVQGGLIEATLAGTAPDVAIGVARGQPVNLASRGALMDLNRFKAELQTVSQRFTDDALLPYSYNGGVYALPVTQTYQVMFYRTDIFKELGLEVPKTWDAFMDAAAVLQRNNMKVGLPYTAITATGAVEVGVGAKDLFPTLLLQSGEKFYTDALDGTALIHNQKALEVFEQWVRFYTDYGFDLSYDFATLFRSGEMPMCITAYPMYGTLAAVATEIRGCWEMTTLPGTVQPDGTINYSAGASGSAAVIMRDAKDPEACWKFLEWFTRADTQSEYGNRLENQLGEAARYATANIEAVQLLKWSSQEKEILRLQREQIQEIPEIPGSYYTSRCLDNAFRSVIYDGSNPRKVFEKQVKIIDSEIKRKLLELQ